MTDEASFMARGYDHMREQFGPELDDMHVTRAVLDMCGDPDTDLVLIVSRLVFAVGELESRLLAVEALLAGGDEGGAD